jgi:hypothetical protein
MSMGLTVYVYRTATLGDCTGGGISGRHAELTVVNIEGPSKPRPDAPAVALLDGAMGTKRLVPVLGSDEEGWQMVAPEGYVGPMMGGNYAASSDGRFRDACGFYGAIPVHDRYETVAQYASYD